MSVHETIPDAARRIRQMQPIAGAQATNEESAVRCELIELTLARRDVQPGDRVWYTAQLTSGRITGVWAHSAEEAELNIAVWHGEDCHWVVPDHDLRVREEYLSSQRALRNASDRIFPLAPPRRPRDRFAPTASLLDTVHLVADAPILG